MALLVHDGSEGCEYETYASLEAADLFHARRVTANWLDEADDEVREAALVRATDYVDAQYVFADGPVVDGAVHPLIVKATIALAALALTSGFVSQATRDVVEIEQEAAGVGKKRTKFSDRDIADPYPFITAMLAPVTGQSGGMAVGRLIR